MILSFTGQQAHEINNWMKLEISHINKTQFKTYIKFMKSVMRSCQSYKFM